MSSLCLLLLLVLTGEGDGAAVIMGVQESVFRLDRLPGDFRPPEYANQGFTQTVKPDGDGWIVEIKVVNNALNSKQKAVEVRLPKALSELEARLNLYRDAYAADQTAVLIDWMLSYFQIEYEWDPRQSAADIMARRGANCVGLTAFAMRILAELGLSSRYVTGAAFRATDKAVLPLEGPVLHRWLEVYYPDVGWVFCDPFGKIHFVDAKYVVLAVEGVHDGHTAKEGLLGGRLELLQLRNGMARRGHLADLDAGLLVRPNRLFTVE